jgi:hypothetical protein
VFPFGLQRSKKKYAKHEIIRNSPPFVSTHCKQIFRALFTVSADSRPKNALHLSGKEKIRRRDKFSMISCVPQHGQGERNETFIFIPSSLRPFREIGLKNSEESV